MINIEDEIENNNENNELRDTTNKIERKDVISQEKKTSTFQFYIENKCSRKNINFENSVTNETGETLSLLNNNLNSCSLPPIRAKRKISDIENEDKRNNNDLNHKKIRRDIFGRIIKKKGKHKISFADDLYELYSLQKTNSGGRYNEDYQLSHKTIDCSFKERKGKSSKTMIYTGTNLMDDILKNDKEKSNNIKIIKDNKKSNPLVEIIDVENYKALTKRMSFIPITTIKDEAVCCSQLCLIV